MPRGDNIPELSDKLNVLVTKTGQRQSRRNRRLWPRGLPDNNDINSIVDLATVLGVPRSALYPKNGQLTGEIEGYIRAIYGISETSDCWKMFLDGTADQFWREYEKLYGDPTKLRPNPEPASGPVDLGAAEAAPAEARPVPLQEDRHFDDPDRSANPVAMLSLFAPTNAPVTRAGSIYVSFTLNCPRMIDVTQFECGVKAGILRFDLGIAYTTGVRERRGFGKPAEYDNARLTVHDPDTHRPSWYIESRDGKWIGMLADAVPVDFLLAQGLSPQSIVRASFLVCLFELGVSFPLPSGGNAKPAKAKLKQRLHLLKVIADEDGWATLAETTIRLVEKKGDGAR